jgi:ABC-2 type transport system permease protein
VSAIRAGSTELEHPERDLDPAGPRAAAAWRVVAGQECRDLWCGTRGPVLLLGLGVLLSVITYLAGSNRALNFLEQRETVNLTLQVAVAVGVLLSLAVSADAISGERERGTLEALLLTPVARRDLVLGKLIAAMSLWFAAFGVAVPYLWALARGVSVLLPALLLGLLVGTVLAVALAGLGLLISSGSTSNRVSLSASLFLLLALFAPTQLPSGLPAGWFGALLDRVTPVSSGLHYITFVLVNGHPWTADLSYLTAPVLTAILAVGAGLVTAPALVQLTPGRDR